MAQSSQNKLKPLYAMVEDGVADPDDIPKERIAVLGTGHDRAKEASAHIKVRPDAASFDAQAIAGFGQIMRDSITSDPVPEGLHPIDR